MRGAKRSGRDEQNHLPRCSSSRLLRGFPFSSAIVLCKFCMSYIFPSNFAFLHCGTAVVGGVDQPDGDCVSGRDARLQRLWRSAHLYRLAQGGGSIEDVKRCLLKTPIPGEPADSQQRREVFHRRSQLLHRPDDQSYH